MSTDNNLHKGKIHSVKYNFVMNFILTASNFIFPLITFPYVSRVLHAEGNGQVNFAISVANYFLMVASLGIPTYGIRACAKVRDDKEKLSRTAQEILIINLIATILVTVTYTICIFTIPRFSQDKQLFFIEGVNIVLNMFGANWLYQALEQYDYITARSILFKAISVILMFLLVHQQSDYHIYAATTVLAAVGSNVMNFARLHKYISFKKIGKYNFRQHLKPIFVLFAQSATVSIYTNLDTVMLGFMKANRDVGLYTAAVKVKNVLLSVVASLGNVMLPRMSYFVSKKNKDEFRRLLIIALNAEIFMAFPLVAYFVFEAKDCIVFLAGAEYIDAVAAMQIINLAIIPNALTGVIGTQTLTALNRENQVLYSVIVGAASDFILNLFMISRWGATGAAFATMIAEYLVLLTQLLLGRDIVLGVFKKVKFFRYAIVTVLALLPTIAISMIPITNSFIRLVITAFVFFIVYAGLLYLKKDELMYRLLDNRFTASLIKKRS
jgi:O-antigen/teichoic acid export membrane protein